MIEIIVNGNAEDSCETVESEKCKAEITSRKKSQGDDQLPLLCSKTEDSCEASEAESLKQDADTAVAFKSMKCNETAPVNGRSKSRFSFVFSFFFACLTNCIGTVSECRPK